VAITLVLLASTARLQAQLYGITSSIPIRTRPPCISVQQRNHDGYRLGVPIPGTRANGINSSGVVVGQGLVTTSSFHAFLYAGGKMVDLGGGYQASASVINDSGQIVGNGTTAGAFLYSNGKMVSLGVPLRC
jgi:probable HAF family extracellular repeat protein